MNTPRHRYTVMPLLVAFMTALGYMPATDVVQVNRDGMGLEHEQPWRRRAEAARETLTGFRTVFAALTRHALFKPIAATCAVTLAALVFGVHAALAFPIAVGTVLTEGYYTGEFLSWEAHKQYRESVTVLSGQNLGAGAVVGRVRYGIGRVSIPAVSGTGNGTVSGVFAGPEVEVGSYVVTCTAAATDAGTFSVTTPSGKLLPSATVAVAYTSRHINFTIADGSSDYIVGDSFTFVVSTTAPTVIGGTGTGTISALALGPDAKPGNYRVINRAVVANGGDFEVIGPDGDSVGRFLMGTGSTGAATFTTRQIVFTLTDATDFILGNYFDVAVFNQLNRGKVVAWDPTTYDGRHRVAGILYEAKDASSADLGGVLVAKHAVVQKDALRWGAAITAAQKESAYLELAARSIVAVDTVTV